MIPTFRATIENGKLVLNHPDMFAHHLRSLEGKVVQVTVKIPRPPRSENQNAYYWGVVINLIARSNGYNPDDATDRARVHDALKRLFLTTYDGKLPIVGSTTDMNTVEFEEYMANVRAWASAEMNCYIPLPNETEQYGLSSYRN